MRIKRSKYLFFHFGDLQLFGLDHIYKRNKALDDQVLTIPILLGKEILIERGDLSILRAIPTNKWIKSKALSIEQEKLEYFMDKGMIISDDCSKWQAKIFYERDRCLDMQKWNIYGALYYYMTKWRDVDINSIATLTHQQKELPTYLKNLEIDPSKLTDIPSHFHKKGGAENRVKLKSKFGKNKFYKILKKRKTHRNFDMSKPMKKKQLSKILYYVFGCHGIDKNNHSISLIKKTSPSSGSLHSLEVYPLVINVNKVSPGIYHYNQENHELYPISQYSRIQARRIANNIATGQTYASESSVLFLITSRFYRHHAKYAKHPKAIANIFKEAGHFCQTFYLVCTEIGLGAFTTVMNEINFEAELGLNGISEGAISLMGCGQLSEKTKKIHLEREFEPFSL